MEDKDQQIDEMREWFYSNYEDPGDSCPYESKSGGYIYIWGGPYDAYELLSSEFGSSIDDDIIKELTNELEDTCLYWSKIPSNEDPYDDDFFSDTFFDLLENAEKSLSELKQIVDSDSDNNQTLLKMVFAQTISVMEAFLSDYFIRNVLNDENHLVNLLEKNPIYKKQNLTYSNLITEFKNIKVKCTKDLTDLIWHNLEKVSNLYNNTLAIEFPSDLSYIYSAISIRHDIVHRNGKNKDGEIIRIEKDMIYELHVQIISLLQYIDMKYMDLYSQF